MQWTWCYKLKLNYIQTYNCICWEPQLQCPITTIYIIGDCNCVTECFNCATTITILSQGGPSYTSLMNQVIVSLQVTEHLKNAVVCSSCKHQTCLPGHFLFQNRVSLVWGYECKIFLISGQTNWLQTNKYWPYCWSSICHFV